MVHDNFTSKGYKIFKSQNKYFIIQKEYLLGVEFTLRKDGIQIETAHSLEKGLFIKFVDYLTTEYQIVFSGNSQSTQAEKAWKKIIKNSNNVYIDVNGDVFKINKNDTNQYYNKNTRIGISKNKNDNYTIREEIYKEKLLNSGGFRKLVNENPKEADKILFNLIR